MANVTNTISLQDKMTPVLSQIIRSMDTTIKAMKSLNAEANKASQEKAFLKAENAIRAARTSLDGMTNDLKGMKQAGDKVTESVVKWKNPIVTAASALQLLRTGVNALRGGLSILEKFNQEAYVEDFTQARLASQLRLVVKTREEGIKAQQEINKIADAGELNTVVAGSATVAGASQLATYGIKPENIKALLPALQDLSVSMYGVNVSEEQMIQTAQLMGRVFSGQTGALSRYGIQMTDAQKKILETGTQAQKTAAVVELLGGSFGGLAENMAKSSAGAAAQFRNLWGKMFETVGKSSADAFGEIYKSLKNQLPRITAIVQQVMDMVVPFILWVANTGIPFIVSALEAILPIVQSIYNFIANNFSWIEPLISGIGAALLTLGTILGTVAGFTKIVTAATWLWNAALNANPIMLVITLIAGLIVWLVRLWHTNDTFRINIIKAWGFISDGILNAVSFIKIMVVKAFQEMVNFAIGQVNMLISAVNKIPGVDIPLLEKANFGDKIEEEELSKYIKRKQDRAAENAALDAELAASKAAKEETALAPQPTGAEAIWGGFNGKMNIGTIDKIKEPISLGEDDIQFLKDVAMKDFDVRYQQVTPMLTISNMNVSETADVDAVAGALEKMVKEAQSADINMGISYGN